MVNFGRDDLLKLIGEQAVQIRGLQEGLTGLLNRASQLAEENKKLKEDLLHATTGPRPESPESPSLPGPSDSSTSAA